MSERGSAESGRQTPLALEAVDGPDGLDAARRQLCPRIQGQDSVLVVSCARWKRAGVGGLQLLLAAEAALALQGRTLRLTDVSDPVRVNFEQAGMRGWFLESRRGRHGEQA
jgi:anti-anti-sigma regulatory factor